MQKANVQTAIDLALVAVALSEPADRAERDGVRAVEIVARDACEALYVVLDVLAGPAAEVLTQAES